MGALISTQACPVCQPEKARACPECPAAVSCPAVEVCPKCVAELTFESKAIAHFAKSIDLMSKTMTWPPSVKDEYFTFFTKHPEYAHLGATAEESGLRPARSDPRVLFSQLIMSIVVREAAKLAEKTYDALSDRDLFVQLVLKYRLVLEIRENEAMVLASDELKRLRPHLE